MTKPRALYARGLVFGAGMIGAGMISARMAAGQFVVPAPKPPDGATLFRQQCATCHTTDPSEPVRQGPSLFKVIGRRAGKAEGFHYSPGLANADFVWDEAKLDAWLTNPQAVVSDAFMLYRQAKPETRAAIISYLKELN
jgi:cytochrome c